MVIHIGNVDNYTFIHIFRIDFAKCESSARVVLPLWLCQNRQTS